MEDGVFGKSGETLDGRIRILLDFGNLSWSLLLFGHPQPSDL